MVKSTKSESPKTKIVVSTQSRQENAKKEVSNSVNKLNDSICIIYFKKISLDIIRKLYYLNRKGNVIFVKNNVTNIDDC